MIKATLWLLVLGATVGTVLDGFHTFSGTTWYAYPQFVRTVWWQPLLFAAAAVAIGMGRVIVDRVLRRQDPVPGWSQVVAAMALFIGCYAATAFLPWSELSKALLVTACFVGGWLAWDRTALGLAAALLTGLGGWAVERTISSAGLFSYLHPSFGGVALWLPALYFLAALSIGMLARRLCVHESFARAKNSARVRASSRSNP